MARLKQLEKLKRELQEIDSVTGVNIFSGGRGHINVLSFELQGGNKFELVRYSRDGNKATLVRHKAHKFGGGGRDRTDTPLWTGNYYRLTGKSLVSKAKLMSWHLYK